jgi:hypothetical protein
MAPRWTNFTISQIGGMTVSISLKREVWRLIQKRTQIATGQKHPAGSPGRHVREMLCIGYLDELARIIASH